MQEVPQTTAVAVHPDVLQPHPLMLAPSTVPDLLKEDATTSLWVIALFISISLHVLLLLFQKSGRFQSLRFYCLFCVITSIS